MTDTQLVLGRRAAVSGAALESPPADDVEARRLRPSSRAAALSWICAVTTDWRHG
jgi:hypothetical protein